MTELCEVVITAPDPGWLKDFSRKLIEQRLCASAHNFAPVQSIYRWRGEIYERTEGRVSLHTRRDRVAEIVALAKQEHPYEVPGISTRTITDGNPDYLAWIAQETAPEQSQSARTRDRIGPIELLQLSLRLQGRTFGAPGLTAPAVNSEDGREQSRGNERPG